MGAVSLGATGAVHRLTAFIRARSFGTLLACIVVGGLALRVAYVVGIRSFAMSGDGVFYHGAARLLADGKGFIGINEYLREGLSVASAKHPPAWTVVLALPARLGLRSFLEQQLVASCIGAVTIAVVGITGRRLAGPRAGLVAAALIAVYPYAWLYERALLSETLVLLGTAIAILLVLRFSEHPAVGTCALLGAVVGVLALSHSELVLLVVLLLAPVILLARSVPLGRRLAWFGVALAVTAAVLAPWLVYNATRFDKVELLSTQFGPTLRDGNCPATYYGPRLGFVDAECKRDRPPTATPEEEIDGDESVVDSIPRHDALRYIDAHRSRLPVVLVAREGRVWAVFRPVQQMRIEPPRGTPVVVRKGAFYAYWVLLPLGIAGALVLRARAVSLVPFLAFVANVVVAAAITYGYTRYRAAAEVPLVLLSAVGIDALVRAYQSRAGARV
jgi:4-amino-4-deoxy-L-arabinose transferase-like glycosyltransferase